MPSFPSTAFPEATISSACGNTLCSTVLTRSANVSSVSDGWTGTDSCSKMAPLSTSSWKKHRKRSLTHCHLAMDANNLELTLVHIMAWYQQATSHYLSQCWHKFMSLYGVTRPQCVNPLGCSLLHKFDHYQGWWHSQYIGMRVSFSKKSRNLWSWYNFTIFLFKMWKLCIIRNDFSIFHALHIRKSGKIQKTLMPEDKQVIIFHNKVYHPPTLSQFQEIKENTLKQFSVFRVNPLRAKFFRGNMNIYLHLCHFSTLIRRR